jgi:hypothetical protein
MITQKKDIVPLELLVSATLDDGRTISAGAKIYFSEESLMTQPWAKTPRKIPELLGDKEVLVVDLKDAVLVSYEA